MSWVLFFDGECGFCSEAVRRIARWDKRAAISFAPLQGELARERGLSHHADEAGGTMVLLRESDGRTWLRGDAALELARVLGGRWRWLAATAGLAPRGLRDWLYGLIARHRRWFMGRPGICAVPDTDFRNRLRK